MRDQVASRVEQALRATPLLERLSEGSAVVLERIACGGGETRWYYCADATNLRAIATRLRPGSVVSFYFDGRMHDGPRSIELVAAAEAMLASCRDIVVGALMDDHIEIDM